MMSHPPVLLRERDSIIAENPGPMSYKHTRGITNTLKFDKNIDAWFLVPFGMNIYSGQVCIFIWNSSLIVRYTRVHQFLLGTKNGDNLSQYPNILMTQPIDAYMRYDAWNITIRLKLFTLVWDVWRLCSNYVWSDDSMLKYHLLQPFIIVDAIIYRVAYTICRVDAAHLLQLTPSRAGMFWVAPFSNMV